MFLWDCIVMFSIYFFDIMLRVVTKFSFTFANTYVQQWVFFYINKSAVIPFRLYNHVFTHYYTILIIISQLDYLLCSRLCCVCSNAHIWCMLHVLRHYRTHVTFCFIWTVYYVLLDWNLPCYRASLKEVRECSATYLTSYEV